MTRPYLDPPNSTPRWVRMRRMLFVVSAVLAVGFLLAVLRQMNGLSLLLLICLWGVLSVAVPMPHLPMLLRLMARSKPKLATRVERFLQKWEFDQTWKDVGQ